MFGFEKIAERRILEAQRRGDFDNLPGSGKPLTFEDDSLVPEELRLAFKILKNAGCVPPEVEAAKEIRCMEDLMAQMGETEEKYRAMKKLNLLITKLNLMRNSPANLEVPETYEHRLVERFGKNKHEQAPKTYPGV